MEQRREGYGHRLVHSRVLAAWLTHRHLPVALVLLAVVLVVPSLWAGWVADDDSHRLRLTAPAEFAGLLPDFSNSPLELFTFADGDPEHMHRTMDLGFWPWWTLPELRAAFFRPLTALTHVLDYRCWPDHPALMHAQSLLWFAGLVGSVAMLFRRFMGLTWVAGAAALLYAIDDAHALPAGWLANRNSLLATMFGVLAIIAYDRWRRDRWRPGAVAGPLLLALSLLSKEAGVATCAYLLSHALFLDHGTWRRRVVALLPYICVVVIWRLVCVYHGYGVWGTGFYVDPGVEPSRYLVAVLERVPILLLGQWLLPPSDLYMVGSVMGAIPFYSVGAALLLVLIGMVVIPQLPWNPTTRFWAVGMMLSLLPICAAFSGDRLLGFVGLGGAALMAQFLEHTLRATHTVSLVSSGRLRRFATKTTVVLFVAVHIVLAPIALALHAGMPMGPPSLLRNVEVRVPMDRSVERQSVVVVTAPVPIFAAFLQGRRALEGLPIPAHTRVLAPYQFASVEVCRTDAQTLVIRPSLGFLAVPFDRLARNLKHPMSLGQRVELTGMTVTVTALTEDGRPAEATFRFSVPLEDNSLRWLNWKDDTFRTFTPPAVGETVVLK